MTNATIGDRDVAVLYGDQGSDGETVLRYATQPTVQVTGGPVDHDLGRRHRRPAAELQAQRPDPGDHHRRRARDRCCCCSPTSRPPRRSGAGHRDRSGARARHPPAAHRGERRRRQGLTSPATTATDNGIEVFTVGQVSDLERPAVHAKATADRQPRPARSPPRPPITLPALTNWKHQAESPEAQPGFDDSTWAVADKTTTNSVTGVGSLPVLYADDYGFHTGNTWYRGRFRYHRQGDRHPSGLRLRRRRAGVLGLAQRRPSSAAPPPAAATSPSRPGR